MLPYVVYYYHRAMAHSLHLVQGCPTKFRFTLEAEQIFSKTDVKITEKPAVTWQQQVKLGDGRRKKSLLKV